MPRDYHTVFDLSNPINGLIFLSYILSKSNYAANIQKNSMTKIDTECRYEKQVCH